MIKVLYSNHADQRLYVKLIRTGLTEDQAIAQLELMGIQKNLELPEWMHMYRYDDTKKKFPYYYGKRRYWTKRNKQCTVQKYKS